MSKKINISATFNSQNPLDLIAHICSNLQPFNQKSPSIVTDGYEEYKKTKNWIDELIPKFKFDVIADWGNK